MLKRGNFSIKFRVKGVPFQEEYELPYRTEELDDNTPRQSAKKEISKSLGVPIGCIMIDEVLEIHNHLIVEWPC